jgi:diguanylate cyclase (GGDEF)-like protein
MLTRTLSALEALPKSLVFGFCLLAIAGVCVVDYATGEDITLSVFYAIPVAIGVWLVGRSAGVVLAAIGVACWALPEGLGDIGFHSGIPYWNAAVRLSFFVLIVLVLSAFHNAMRHEQRLARTDPLTHVSNGRSFYELADLEVRRARRYEWPLTLVYFDIDNLKMVNDKHGHSSGDILIQTVAQLFARSLRATDVIARLGGDEFAALLPATDDRAAAAVLEKITQGLREAEAGAAWGISVSGGAVTYYEQPASFEAMIHEADALMYEVKSSGKNGFRQAVRGTQPASGAEAVPQSDQSGIT